MLRLCLLLFFTTFQLGRASIVTPTLWIEDFGTNYDSLLYHVEDAAVIMSGAARLTPDVVNQAGRFSCGQEFDLDEFTLSFKFRIDGESANADGIVCFWHPSLTPPISYGASMGWAPDSTGVGIKIDTYENVWDNGPNRIALIQNGVVEILADYAFPEMVDADWHTLSITKSGTSVMVKVDNDTAFVMPLTQSFDRGHFFFSAGTGTYSDSHWIDDIHLQVGAYTCPPTSLPFIDNFDSSELDSCWTWIREDTSRWSLTERPGWMRIEPYYFNSNYVNLLVRTVRDSNLVIQTKLQHETSFGTSAGLLVYLDDDNFIYEVFLDHGYTDGPIVRLHTVLNGVQNASHIPAHWSDVYLKIVKVGNSYSVNAAPDSLSWQHITTLQRDLGVSGTVRVGLFTEAWSSNYPPADFDYFRVDPLPGTTVCGDVSGVWDSTRSPYYVTCDVTVPAGQTLEIQPGVDVLFTGHYKFNVFGNLQAIGTEQDSIVFTRAFPTEESKGAGIRILDTPDTSSFVFCRLEYQSAPWPEAVWEYHRGGAIGLYRSGGIIVSNCTFNDNFAGDGAGALAVYWAPYCLVESTEFLNNSSDCHTVGGAGGIQLGLVSNTTIRKCLFVSNVGSCNGSAIVSDECDYTVSNCTFAGNDCPGVGSVAYIWVSGVVDFKNCIVWDNQDMPFAQTGGELSVIYSDIQGGYPGTGNIDNDPEFTSDFHLQVGSPCINSGDPTSSLDPDGSRADMGAFPFYKPPVCGTVTGVWPAHANIKVACDLLVPDGDSLIIEPGVSVEFLGDYKLTVEGKLIAQGTATDSIHFWTDTLVNPDRWSGIRFIQADSLSRLEFCLFEFGDVTGVADSGYGGAVYCSNSSPLISHCRFAHNTARNGGGLNLNIGAHATVQHCMFEANQALERGGALWIWDSAPHVSNCRFERNTAVTGGGAIRARQDVVLTLDSCEFVDNEGTTHGGALFASVLCSLDVQHSVFMGNHGTEGGAIAADTSFMQMQDCRFSENSARWGGAVNAKRMLPASEIQRTIFRSNHSIPLGSAGAGGAVALYSQPMTLRHCLLDSNTARLGGALEVTLTQGNFDNCTVVNNSATVSGSVGYSWQGHHRYNSCILDGNTAATAFFLDGGSSTAEVRYSDWDQMPVSFANIIAPAGFGNLTATNVNGDSVDTYGNLFMEPQFGVNEYDLQWNSPAIDAGDPLFAPDADGTPADQGWKAYYQPSITVTPDSLDFGTLFYGEAAERFVTIINPSSVAAPLLDLYWNDAAFAADTLPDWLAAGDTLVLSVVFTPPIEGTYNDTLRLASRLAGPDVLEIPMAAIVPLVPSAVDSLVITRGALNGTQLYWAPVTTTTSGQPFTPTYYIIYGATSSDGPYVPFGVSTTTSYNHPFIINTEPKYFYYVTASDGSAVTGVDDNMKELENGE